MRIELIIEVNSEWNLDNINSKLELYGIVLDWGSEIVEAQDRFELKGILRRCSEV